MAPEGSASPEEQARQAARKSTNRRGPNRRRPRNPNYKKRMVKVIQMTVMVIQTVAVVKLHPTDKAKLALHHPVLMTAILLNELKKLKEPSVLSLRSRFQRLQNHKKPLLKLHPKQ